MVLAFWLILQNEPNCNSKIMDIFREKISSNMEDKEFFKLREKLDL
jgi:hypothetical protein